MHVQSWTLPLSKQLHCVATKHVPRGTKLLPACTCSGLAFRFVGLPTTAMAKRYTQLMFGSERA